MKCLTTAETSHYMRFTAALVAYVALCMLRWDTFVNATDNLGTWRCCLPNAMEYFKRHAL